MECNKQTSLVVEIGGRRLIFLMHGFDSCLNSQFQDVLTKETNEWAFLFCSSHFLPFCDKTMLCRDLPIEWETIRASGVYQSEVAVMQEWTVYLSMETEEKVRFSRLRSSFLRNTPSLNFWCLLRESTSITDLLLNVSTQFNHGDFQQWPWMLKISSEGDRRTNFQQAVPRFERNRVNEFDRFHARRKWPEIAGDIFDLLPSDFRILRIIERQRSWMFFLDSISRTIIFIRNKTIICPNTSVTSTRSLFLTRSASLCGVLISLFTSHDQSTTIFFNWKLCYLTRWQSQDPSSKFFNEWTTSFECRFAVEVVKGEIHEPHRCLGNNLKTWIIGGHLQVVENHAQWLYVRQRERSAVQSPVAYGMCRWWSTIITAWMSMEIGEQRCNASRLLIT